VLRVVGERPGVTARELGFRVAGDGRHALLAVAQTHRRRRRARETRLPGGQAGYVLVTAQGRGTTGRGAAARRDNRARAIDLALDVYGPPAENVVEAPPAH
jgi:hypothetical protein